MAAPELFSEGNNAFVDENYDLAIQKYSAAIEQNAFNPEYYIKRSTAFLKLENYKDACTDASVAVDLDKTNHKAYLRKGIAYFHAEDYKTANESFLKGHELNESNKDVTAWLEKCKARLGEDNSVQAEAAKVNKDHPSEKQLKQEEPTATPIQQPLLTMPTAAKARYDWYQTETHVVVSIMIKNCKQEDVSIEYGNQHLSVTVKLPSGSEYSLELDLSYPIQPSQCHTRVLKPKIELKMKKQEAIRWPGLEADQSVVKVAQKYQPEDTKAHSDIHQYPSSKHVVKDWDKLAADVAKEEADEKLEGEAALNTLFQKIYGEGTDEVRQAMNKSFVESGGTVLSTNWAEIGKEKVERKPPDGMEWKEWEN